MRHIVNRKELCVMMESKLKTLYWVNNTNYPLPSSCQLLHGLPIVLRKFLQKALPDDLTFNVVSFHLQGKQLPSTLNKIH